MNTKQQKALGYVVELESGVWYVSDLDGDPGRTLLFENATIFRTIRAAQRAIEIAKQFRPWRNGPKVIAVFKNFELKNEKENA